MAHPVSDSYDYGACDICETPMHAQSITQDFWIRGELLVFERVVGKFLVGKLLVGKLLVRELLVGQLLVGRELGRRVLGLGGPGFQPE